MFDMDLATAFGNSHHHHHHHHNLLHHHHHHHLQTTTIAMSPTSTTKSQPNSPMSPAVTPIIKKEAIMVQPSNNNNDCSNSSIGSNSTDIFASKCKRKINFTHVGAVTTSGTTTTPGKTSSSSSSSSNQGTKVHQPATVARRNARERNRVKQVNNGFAALKQHIPLGHRSKKMSKVETLRCAVEYIKSLKGLLDPEGNHHHFNHGNENSFPELLQTAANKFELVGHGSNYNQLSPSSSEDPSSPSYASEGSYVTSTAITSSSYDCENYEPVSPEDEELLDAISWWQQS